MTVSRPVSPTPAATSPPPGEPPPRFGVFRALRHRNYRLFFGGQTVSLIGTWITRVATSWLVYRLTDSVLLLGVVGFFSQIPTLVLSPLSGVLVDRWDRRRTLVTGQALRVVNSACLSALVLSGHVQVWQFVLFGVFCFNLGLFHLGRFFWQFSQLPIFGWFAQTISLPSFISFAMTSIIS